MRVIPVIDLMNGQVVRGIGGKRSEYQPIKSQIATDAQPATVARAFVEHFGFDTAYVADLDAIQGRPPNLIAWKEIHAAGLKLWLDAGIGTPQACAVAHKLAHSLSIDANLVVALESLQDPDEKRWLDISARAAAHTFSLDLKESVPLHQIPAWQDRSAVEIAHSVHARGFSNIIVLDLADVGSHGGTRTLSLCRQLVAELHPVRIIAGGGVRGLTDLQELTNAGCDAALVASALHDGRLTPADLRQGDFG
jgi:phosphoribosylformimino-5-aminoimidazole carboxamide ribotide isomerase